MHKFEDLIEGCKKRRQQAMLEIYKLCCNEIFNSSLRITLNAEDSEEITQDAFLKAFDNIDKFSGNCKNFISFVKLIAVNKSIDLYRRNHSRPVFVDMEPGEKDVSYCENPEDEEEPEYSVEMVKEKMAEMPEGYRMVLEMRLLDDMEFEEIAEVLHIQASTVRSQYARAKNKLRENLKKYYL